MTDETLKLDEEQNTQPEETAQEVDWAAEAQKFKDLYMRSAAEMENMRRRLKKEMDDKARFAAEKIVRGLLPVMDNLSLALGYVTADSSDELKGMAEGIHLTFKSFMDVMGENGVKMIDAGRGQTFDPNIHDAIGQAPETDIPAGTISQEIQKGYMLYDRLVRPAKVLVATAAN